MGEQESLNDDEVSLSTHRSYKSLHGQLCGNDLAPVFPDPSYSQLSARSVMDSERTCAA